VHNSNEAVPPTSETLEAAAAGAFDAFEGVLHQEPRSSTTLVSFPGDQADAIGGAAHRGERAAGQVALAADRTGLGQRFLLSFIGGRGVGGLRWRWRRIGLCAALASFACRLPGLSASWRRRGRGFLGDPALARGSVVTLSLLTHGEHGL
jgi:hypothetical protein